MDYQDTWRSGITLIALLVLSTVWMQPGLARSEPRYSLPMDCSGDEACFLQNLIDMDTGPKLLDPLCGRATFNGHKGTDIRVKNLATMNSGIAVLAMADGTVGATRDGVADRLMETPQDTRRVRGRECGNGVLIDHSTDSRSRHSVQYCHLANGSVIVKKGDRVRRGQKIGQIGLSGATQFPHVHFSTRINGDIVDPLTGVKMGRACAGSSATTPLFSTAALREIFQIHSRRLLEDGYTSHAVNGKAVLKGEVKDAGVGLPLIYFAKFINLKKGDVIRLMINGPDGIYARSATRPLAGHKATYTAYVGKKSSTQPGVFQGQAVLVREGKDILVHRAAPVSLR